MDLDIEMIFDPIEVARMDGLCLDENHHICPESQWLRTVKRVTGRDDIFVYYHKQTKNFVLAQWIYTPEKDGIAICTELEVMGKAPDRGGWLPIEYMKKRCSASSEMAKELRNRIKEDKYRKQAEKEELLHKRTSAVNYLKRQGKDAAAAALETSKYTKPSEETLDKLQSAASGKIITSG